MTRLAIGLYQDERMRTIVRPVELLIAAGRRDTPRERHRTARATFTVLRLLGVRGLIIARLALVTIHVLAAISVVTSLQNSRTTSERRLLSS